MSMPLLYNIEIFNNTVTKQSSASMYTDVYRILSFSITKGVTRPVSSDLQTHFVDPLSFRGGHQRFQCTCSLLSCPQSAIALCMSRPTEYGK